MKKRFEILFEDDDYIVVDKPAGMLCIPDRYDPQKVSLANILKKKREEIFIVHRIDRNTSGLVLLCKNAKMHQALSKHFEERKIDKSYVAIVHGRIRIESGEIDTPILIQRDKAKVLVNSKGKPSKTIFSVRKSFQNYSTLDVKIITGRRHQIRAHLASIAHPIVADDLYGTSDRFMVSQIKKKYNLKKFETEKPLISRQALHAAQLKFSHPFTNKECAYIADLPKDMRALNTQLGKWNAEE